MRDEANEPLGQNPLPLPFAARYGLTPQRAALWILILAASVGGALWWRAATDGDRGVAAVAEIEFERPPAATPTPTPSATEAAASPGSRASGTATGDEVEAASGVKVVRNGGGGAPGALIIDVPQTLGVRLTPAPDPRLVEASRFGALPRIGADGARPADVYARPVVEPVKLKNAPRLAVVIGGLGLDAASTNAAIDRLPAAVSLGFAPYGADLAAVAARARAAGHEILLQAPMEAFDGAPPSPHMLTIAAGDVDNREQIRWMMGRFPGFIGVENYRGGKFTADAGAFAPALAEIAARGLAYLDDGSSPRSLALSLAPGLNLRVGAADVVIDSDPSPEAIEVALAKLEALARRQDGAIGVATALPASLDHIARWAAALEARGVALVPVSALLSRPPGRSAGATP